MPIADTESAYRATLGIYIATERAVHGFDASVLLYLEVAVCRYQSLQLYVVRRQFYHGFLVAFCIRFFHAYAYQRQLAVHVLYIDARAFGLYHQSCFLQRPLVLVIYGCRNFHQSL